MQSDRLKPGDKVIVNGEIMVFTKCEPFGEYWRVHLGDKIIKCTRNWEWQIQTRFTRKRKRGYRHMPKKKKSDKAVDAEIKEELNKGPKNEPFNFGKLFKAGDELAKEIAEKKKKEKGS